MENKSVPPPLPAGLALPTPVIPLSYVGYGPNNPPPRQAHQSEGSGLAIAVGVVSILLAVVGFCVNGLGLSIYWSGYRGSVPPPPPPSPPPMAPVTFAPYDGDFVGPRGIKADMRDAVARLWEKSAGAELSNDRKAMLHRILSDAGTDAFAASTPSQLAAEVREVARSARALERDVDLLVDRRLHCHCWTFCRAAAEQMRRWRMPANASWWKV